jgi:hypothetical protein
MVVSTSALPATLTTALGGKSWQHHIDAMNVLVQAVTTVCPGIQIEEKSRYHAFYRGKKILVYIDPQQGLIRFGFFASHIHMAKARITTAMEDFPEWNRSKGGLVGLSLLGEGRELATRTADIAYLIIEAFKGRSGAIS